MGLGKFLQKQFIDVLQWTEDSDDVLAWRYPVVDQEIQYGGQLVVRETQEALFVDQGQVADRFSAGRHKLQTQNLPVLTNLRHWDKLFQSPFKSDVFFFSSRRRVGLTWGTSQPVTVRDAEFGVVRVRAFGVFSFHLADVTRFFRQVSGTRETYTVGELEPQLRATLANALAQTLGNGRVPFLELAANHAEVADGVLSVAQPHFVAIGLQLDEVQVQSVSLPEEIQKRLDERIGMGVVGDLTRYTQFQTARSIPLAAEQQGGAAGAGVGMGAGIVMGQTMAQTMAAANAPAVATAAAAVVCGRCQKTLERRTRFCPECGNPLG
jgi:membrane protease subunit (stomatin/prohibitin family)